MFLAFELEESSFVASPVGLAFAWALGRLEMASGSSREKPASKASAEGEGEETGALGLGGESARTSLSSSLKSGKCSWVELVLSSELVELGIGVAEFAGRLGVELVSEAAMPSREDGAWDALATFEFGERIDGSLGI